MEYKKIQNKYAKYIITQIDEFRQLCRNKIHEFHGRHVPCIKKNQKHEVVFIECRELPHIEFLIRNAIDKLGKEWSYTFLCGNLNYKMVTSMCESISNNITIIKLPVDNLTQSEYSDYLCTLDFWNLFTGEKILIHQEDSCVFKKNINDFIHFDYIGAPFLKKDDTPVNVGNGGLSLRTRQCMIDIINAFPKESTPIQPSTLKYMQSNSLKYIPEDIYFCTNIHHFNNKYVIADWEPAYEFSTESVYNPNSFGGHQFWHNDPNWKSRITLMNVTGSINQYKIDYDFNRKCYLDNNLDKIGEIIVNPTQLVNLFKEKIVISENSITYNNVIDTIDKFVLKLNAFTYNDFYLLTMKLIVTKLKLNKLLLLVFIGNDDVGIDLINRIIKYKELQDYAISFCVHYAIVDNFIEIIQNNFDNYAIYSSNEFGNDITPTILMYNDIIQTQPNFEYIIKLHTKTNYLYNELVSFLLTCTLDELIHKKDALTNCNCLGNNYMESKNDPFNQKLYKKCKDIIITDNNFVEGTVFFTDAKCFNKTNDFFKENYYIFFISNMYDNNSVNIENSYVHFLERLFGIISI